MLFNFRTKLAKYQLASLITTCAANFFLFIATLTPAWQVADDLDADRYVQSGLWLYCPGAAQCWYIFSDSLINYYEKVDVCRFFLIGDCRKKLLRTPYFFDWHYAVLILNIITMVFLTLATIAILVSYFKKNRARLCAIFFDVLIFAACLFLAISLIVFMVNAEMLESKYLIGVKNTYEKYYGYSFYLAGFALLLITFAILFATLITTYTFFFVEQVEEDVYHDNNYAISMENKFGQNYPNNFATPLTTQIPNTEHGSYIAGSISPNGEFKSQTRHFYSY
ncbi:unnamed protein product [Caenorhabditis bovis]|uniref:Uncharacterized protein n=1 Tax=Caenorhabditis bovis TaxID=2654633 RepID=A0A8S1EG07_9PELO|nr:unnamed protein product [Caenorhabditis bovis]